ncbi:hypothetical protein [Rufibacter sp. LB8]|uniref:hypothetical protein n=1 Tax=Rufibacter sp. LB8 TaxID=2777781 RepID=UPI00178C7268|nr:hypothetical protein [Rufibacter sp. LB8]
MRVTTDKKDIILVVYYNSFQPIATLPLQEDDDYIAWLVDSTNAIPCGNYYCLRLTTAQELRQVRRIFPAIGRVNRHLRYRGVLRKKAQKRMTTAVPTANQFQETYTFQPAISSRAAAILGFKWGWVKSFFQLSLNNG